MFSQVSLALRTGYILFMLLSPMLSLKRRLFARETLETENGKNSKNTQLSQGTLSTISSHLTKPMNDDTFENFWLEIVEYAEEAGVSPTYIEEEFLLDGELIKAPIHYKKQSK